MKQVLLTVSLCIPIASCGGAFNGSGDSIGGSKKFQGTGNRTQSQDLSGAPYNGGDVNNDPQNPNQPGYNSDDQNGMFGGDEGGKELPLHEIDQLEDEDIRDCLLNFDYTFKKDILKNIVKREVETDVPQAALAELFSVKGPKKPHVVILKIKTIRDALNKVTISNPNAFVCIHRSPGTIPILGIPAPISATAFFNVHTTCVEQVSIFWSGVVHVGGAIKQEGSSKGCLVKKY